MSDGKSVWSRSFLLLWIGQAVSQVGNRIYLMALAWYFVAVLNDPTGVLLLFIIASLPSLLLGVFAGPIVERFNKKWLVVACDLVSAFLTALLTLLVATGHAGAWAIYVTCFLLNAVNLLFSPSVNSIFPAILPKEHYQRGASLIKMVTFLGQIMGAAVGGALVGLLGVKWSIGVNSVSFLLSALASACIVYREPLKAASRGYLSDIREGFRHLREERVLARVLGVAVAVNLFLPSFIVFIPIIVKTEMNLDAIHYGMVDAAIPVGALVASVVLSFWRMLAATPVRTLSVSIVGIAVAYLLVAVWQSYAALLVAGLLFGVLTNSVNVQVLTFFMSKVDARFRGRIFSLLESFSYASISLSYVLATVMSASLNIYRVLLINAFCLVCIAAVTLWFSRTKQ
ncbi:MAG: MFS transporter [Prevotella sp.]